MRLCVGAMAHGASRHRARRALSAWSPALYEFLDEYASAKAAPIVALQPDEGGEEALFLTPYDRAPRSH